VANLSSPTNIAVEIERAHGHAVVSLAGDLDMSGVPTLEAALEPVLATVERLTFDLASLRFIDSSGIAVILRAAGTTSVSVRNASVNVRRVLRVTGLLGLLHVDEDVRHFPCAPGSVPEARGFVVSALIGESQEVRDRAELLVSELATNAVLHARTEFSVVVTSAVEAIRVAVTDSGEGQPERRSPSGLEPRGRGLQIVDALSDHWGVEEAAPTGKSVSFVIKRRSSEISS
jgi:anti-anti-sigma factor